MLLFSSETSNHLSGHLRQMHTPLSLLEPVRVGSGESAPSPHISRLLTPFSPLLTGLDRPVSTRSPSEQAAPAQGLGTGLPGLWAARPPYDQAARPSTLGLCSDHGSPFMGPSHRCSCSQFPFLYFSTRALAKHVCINLYVTCVTVFPPNIKASAPGTENFICFVHCCDFLHLVPSGSPINTAE